MPPEKPRDAPTALRRGIRGTRRRAEQSVPRDGVGTAAAALQTAGQPEAAALRKVRSAALRTPAVPAAVPPAAVSAAGSSSLAAARQREPDRGSASAGGAGERRLSLCGVQGELEDV